MEEIDLLEEINSISKIHTLKRDDIDRIMIELAQRITQSLRIERISVWLMDAKGSSIVSIGEYDSRDNVFSKDSTLLREDAPNYFEEIAKNDIIYVKDVTTSSVTESMNENYNLPNQIISLLDVPLRMDGRLIGVMCYEKTGSVPKEFNEKERFFAMSTSLVFASSLEARARRTIQEELDQQLAEKETLLKEIHHRVKNNLAVVSSLIKLQSEKARDEYHRSLLNECVNKIRSIADIHEIVYQNNSLSEISAVDYFNKLLDGIQAFYSQNDAKVDLVKNIQDFTLSIEKMIPLGLIVNEVITNAYKHAFTERNTGLISFDLVKSKKSIELTIKDTGVGIAKDSEFEPKLGMEIISDLAEQLDAEYAIKASAGTEFSLVFAK